MNGSSCSSDRIVTTREETPRSNSKLFESTWTSFIDNLFATAHRLALMSDLEASILGTPITLGVTSCTYLWSIEEPI